MAQVDRIEIDNDPDPDLSWPDHRDKANHVTLMMIAYDEDDKVVDSLGGIDFLIDGYTAYVKRLGVAEVVSPLRLPTKMATIALVVLSLIAPCNARGYGGHSLGRVHLSHTNSASTHPHARR